MRSPWGGGRPDNPAVGSVLAPTAIPEAHGLISLKDLGRFRDGYLLIFRDDAATRHGVARLPENAGFEVSEAEDGIAASNTVQEKQFDLVFLDI